MSTTEQQCPIAHAATLLRESAEELRETATLAPSHEWIEGKDTSAKAAHDEYMAVAMALDGMSEENANLRAGYDAARLEIASLQAQLEAVGAGGVGRLAPDVSLISEGDMPAAPAQPVAWQVNHIADHVADNWPMRKYDLAEIEQRLRGIPAAPQPAAQALDSARVFWQQHTQSDALSMTMAELHADVELVIRAARGAAQAAPVDASVLRDQEGARKPLHPVEAMRLILNVEQRCNHMRGTTNWAAAIARAIEAAHGIAAQKGEKK